LKTKTDRAVPPGGIIPSRGFHPPLQPSEIKNEQEVAVLSMAGFLLVIEKYFITQECGFNITKVGFFQAGYHQKRDTISLLVLMNMYLTLAIVILTYIGIAVGRYPIIKSNRATVALLGVGMLLVARQIDFAALPDYLDFNTLILLFSMMIINANLRLAGFFTLAGGWLLRFARTPRMLLALEILLVGVLSALFLNDTICLMFTPFLLEMMDTARRNPIPYLIALATASNIGSVATLTGNPQNMIIGVASGISYLQFTWSLLPIAVASLGIIWVVIVKLYPYEFKPAKISETTLPPVQVTKPLLVKTLVVVTGLLIAFLAGVPVAAAAFLAACVLLITRRHQPQMVFAEFDWGLLVFFSGLFIVSGSLETSGLTHRLISSQSLIQNLNAWNLTLVTAILSNLVSNVPAVLLLKPLVTALANPAPAWLTLAAASTLAGNLTLLGSVANLIVAEIANRWRVDLGFWEYARAGIIITILSLLISAIWLALVIWRP